MMTKLVNSILTTMIFLSIGQSVCAQTLNPQTREEPVAVKSSYKLVEAVYAQHNYQNKRPSTYQKLLSAFSNIFENTPDLKTDQVATSVARFILAQKIPQSTVLILAPESDHSLSKTFTGYLSAELRQAGYTTTQGTVSDWQHSRVIPFAIDAYEEGVIVRVSIRHSKISRFYSLSPSGAIKAASAYMMTQSKGAQ